MIYSVGVWLLGSTLFSTSRVFASLPQERGEQSKYGNWCSTQITESQRASHELQPALTRTVGQPLTNKLQRSYYPIVSILANVVSSKEPVVKLELGMHVAVFRAHSEQDISVPTYGTPS